MIKRELEIWNLLDVCSHFATIGNWGPTLHFLLEISDLFGVCPFPSLIHIKNLLEYWLVREYALSEFNNTAKV